MALTQQWKDTVQRGVTDKRWDEYDSVIQREVANYNRRFSIGVNWLIPKAMVWVESGGPDNPAWKSRPMQIGNPGDPAYDVLKAGKEGSDVVMDATLSAAVKSAQINTPTVNLQAGIAYLFARMAKWEEKSIPDAKDPKVYTHTVVANDNLWSIAQKNGTTMDELKKMNPTAANMIKPGQVLSYHKAKMGMAMDSWRAWDSTTVASRYNVGDPDYAAKLTYLLSSIFPTLKR